MNRDHPGGTVLPAAFVIGPPPEFVYQSLCFFINRFHAPELPASCDPEARQRSILPFSPMGIGKSYFGPVSLGARVPGKVQIRNAKELIWEIVYVDQRGTVRRKAENGQNT
jgi:hypothetical protein